MKTMLVAAVAMLALAPAAYAQWADPPDLHHAGALPSALAAAKLAPADAAALPAPAAAETAAEELTVGRPPVPEPPPAGPRPPFPNTILNFEPTWTSYVRTRAGCHAAFSLGSNLTGGSEVGIRWRPYVYGSAAGAWETMTVRVNPDPFAPTPVTGLRMWTGVAYEVYARYPNNDLGTRSALRITDCSAGIYA